MAQMRADPWFRSVVAASNGLNLQCRGHKDSVTECRQGLPEQAQLLNDRMMCRHEIHQTAEQLASVLTSAAQASNGRA